MLDFKVKYERTSGHDVKHNRLSCLIKSLEQLPLITLESDVHKAMCLSRQDCLLSHESKYHVGFLCRLNCLCDAAFVKLS